MASSHKFAVFDKYLVKPTEGGAYQTGGGASPTGGGAYSPARGSPPNFGGVYGGASPKGSAELRVNGFGAEHRSLGAGSDRGGASPAFGGRVGGSYGMMGPYSSGWSPNSTRLGASYNDAARGSSPNNRQDDDGGGYSAEFRSSSPVNRSILSLTEPSYVGDVFPGVPHSTMTFRDHPVFRDGVRPHRDSFSPIGRLFKSVRSPPRTPIGASPTPVPGRRSPSPEDSVPPQRVRPGQRSEREVEEPRRVSSPPPTKEEDEDYYEQLVKMKEEHRRTLLLCEKLYRQKVGELEGT